jgi:hypothetical protein
MTPKLLIVTDLGLLKAYKVLTTPKGSLHLDPIETVVLDEARQRVLDKVTDLAGRRGSPTRNAGGAPLADAHNLQLETRRRLVKKIAGLIETFVQKNAECGLWLAARREINASILSALLKNVRHRIEANLPLDLVHADGQELIANFAPAIFLKPMIPSRL